VVDVELDQAVLGAEQVLGTDESVLPPTPLDGEPGGRRTADAQDGHDHGADSPPACHIEQGLVGPDLTLANLVHDAIPG
jgi:hypothetical protein